MVCNFGRWTGAGRKVVICKIPRDIEITECLYDMNAVQCVPKSCELLRNDAVLLLYLSLKGWPNLAILVVKKRVHTLSSTYPSRVSVDAQSHLCELCLFLNVCIHWKCSVPCSVCVSEVLI